VREVTNRQVAPSPENPPRSRQLAPPASAPAAPASASARSGGPTAAQAFALRSAGNRATGRALARWAAHPDKDKKGALVPDSVATEYVRFNPPKNQ
jgi:hypothetical protein